MYQILYEVSQVICREYKKFRVKRRKKLLFCRVPKKHTANPYFAVCFISAHGKLLTLSYAKEKTHGKACFCRVQKNTRQSMNLPCVFFKPGVFVVAHGKVALCRVPDRKHTANLDFPVVLDFYGPIESEILNLTYKKAFPTEQILKPMWTD